MDYSPDDKLIGERLRKRRLVGADKRMRKGSPCVISSSGAGRRLKGVVPPWPFGQIRQFDVRTKEGKSGVAFGPATITAAMIPVRPIPAKFCIAQG